MHWFSWLSSARAGLGHLASVYFHGLYIEYTNSTLGYIQYVAQIV